MTPAEAIQAFYDGSSIDDLDGAIHDFEPTLRGYIIGLVSANIQDEAPVE